jgi:hypothetical protein
MRPHSERLPRWPSRLWLAHADSFKIETLCGNYLLSLSICSDLHWRRPLGDAAKMVLHSWLVHADSLIVKISRGNYLPSLSMCTDLHRRQLHSARPLRRCMRSWLAMCACTPTCSKSMHRTAIISHHWDNVFFFHHSHILLDNTILMIYICCILYGGNVQAHARCQRQRAWCDVTTMCHWRLPRGGHACGRG